MPNTYIPNDLELSDGFKILTGGHNDGISPSLIGTDQVAFASNITFRGGFAKTRNGFANIPLAFESSKTQARFTGKFQGAVEYSIPYGFSGFIVSLGGLLFSIAIGDSAFISEITPKLPIYTVAPTATTPNFSFTVPAPAANVDVPVNNADALASFTTVIIDGGNYTVVSLSEGLATLKYNSGAFHVTVAAGTAVLGTGASSTPLPGQSLDQIYAIQSNPASFDFIDLFQAENYVITLAADNPTIIFDGGSARLAIPDEIPPGIFGIYLWGRIWTVLPNRRNFVAGDLVGSTSGTPSLGYVDAILKMTENSYLNGGGAFSVPTNSGQITGLAALANLDSSLGVGNLLTGTQKSVFSVNTPVDRTTWQNLTYPIQTVSLLKYGPVGPRPLVNVNGDLWYRSADGIRSFVVARREISATGNTPQSQEVSKLLSYDDASMLFYASGILLRNRLYMTASPYRTANGVAHRGMVVLNYDLISNLRTKQPAAWEGLYNGLNVLQLVSSSFGDEERGWAFALNGTSIELWELDTDNYADTFDFVTGETKTSIQSVIETRSMDCGDARKLKKIKSANIYIDELADNVSLQFYYKPDQYPNWVPWTTVNLCANVSQCQIIPPNGSCNVWAQRQNQYAANIILPEPTSGDNPLTGTPLHFGYEFQVRIVATGKFRMRMFVLNANPQTQPTTGTIPEEVTCQTVESCDTPIFGYDSHGGAAAQSVPANALLDNNGNPVLDENGNYILTS